MEKSNIIKDLIQMYVTENYKKYLEINNLKLIISQMLEFNT